MISGQLLIAVRNFGVLCCCSSFLKLNSISMIASHISKSKPRVNRLDYIWDRVWSAIKVPVVGGNTITVNEALPVCFIAMVIPII